MEQTEKQEKLLEKSRKDLEKRKRKESLLKEQLKQKEVQLHQEIHRKILYTCTTIMLRDNNLQRFSLLHL